MHVRPAAEADFPEVRRIQHGCPEAAQWEAADYNVLIAESNGSVAGFLVWRFTAPDEAEVLNLAVAPLFRRQGAAYSLLRALPRVGLFLEVRESNHAARSLYRKAGFVESGIRFGYYSNPIESGIVMRLQS